MLGKYPQVIRKLNSIDNGMAKTSAFSLNNRGLIRPGPLALETLKFNKSSLTSCLVKRIVCNCVCVTEQSGGRSLFSSLTIDCAAKKSFKIFAFSSSVSA